MQDEHYNQDELLNAVYGVEREDDHLALCSGCRARLDSMKARQAQAVASDGEPDAAFFARQRAAVYRRIEKPRRSWAAMRVATAGAGLATVAFALLLLRSPDRPPMPVAAPVDDSKLMAEIYSDLYNAEPRAADPVRALFEEEMAQ